MLKLWSFYKKTWEYPCDLHVGKGFSKTGHRNNNQKKKTINSDLSKYKTSIKLHC